MPRKNARTAISQKSFWAGCNLAQGYREAGAYVAYIRAGLAAIEEIPQYPPALQRRIWEEMNDATGNIP